MFNLPQFVPGVTENILPRNFFTRPTLLVARELLGSILVRFLNGKFLAGKIIETEAYIGEDDLGCHARAGKTKRTSVMYGQPGHAYIYFTYGMHWCLNAVTEREGFPAAVLIRAIQPVLGIETIKFLRNGKGTDGPGKLTQGFGINGELNGLDLCTRDAGLWLEKGETVPTEDLIIGPRVGLFNVPEPWKSMAWRFRVKVR